MELLRSYFPDLTDLQIRQFEMLFPLYQEWNSQINVISRKDIDELYLRHVLHSLAIARFHHFTPGSKILDIGTGGGFPGIPLAIYFPQCEFTLCDSIAKKIKVVDAVAEALNLKNVKTHIGRVEKIDGKFDFIVSRAVAPLVELLAWTRSKLSREQKNTIKNGWICLKGGDLVEEASNTGKDFQLLPLQTWYDEEFFLTKRIVYVKG
ncbi:MAG TPA: 16S rRNA (guanine(527)-N(7))-methyltransferase RsmG [Flavobacteriales bacterium]|nr:16S rRNA (guanine(527)-N(7))-methyltransferase RsmG [Flavobacteriales bacterium]